MRLFVFARHAESSANAAHVLNTDPSRLVGLTDRGRHEARELGNQLAGLDIDLAVHTRFLRTRQTVELALQGRVVPTVVEPALDEVRAGVFDGALIQDYWNWKEHHGPSERFPLGESLDETAVRYARALSGLLQSGSTITLVVCHELAIRYIVQAASGTTSLDHPGPTIANASIYLFDEVALRNATTCLSALAGVGRPVVLSAGAGSA
jgi:broad specificity phosphatase PhoE